MATNWKSASSEMIAERNRKRRERYAQLDLASKERLLREQAHYRVKLSPEERQRREDARVSRSSGSTFSLTNPDGSVLPITNPDMVAHLQRAEARVSTRKTSFQKKIDRIQAWRDDGGGFPWPSLQDKAEITCLWIKIAHLLGRKCHQCGESENWDFSWRITRKDDFLAFVPFQKAAYTKVLRDPDQYCIYCLHCSFDLRLLCFSYIFSPHSPRNAPTVEHGDFVGPRFADWAALLPAMYPRGFEQLANRIECGAIKSLSCGIKGPHGRFVRTFIRKNQFHAWVGLQPRDFSWHCMVQVREFYSRLNPSVDCDYWGFGRFTGEQNLTVENSGWDAVDENTKQFLREVPAKWERKKLDTSRVLSAS